MNEDGRDLRPGTSGAPWINLDMQKQMAWRDGDIVISVPLKSGTNWMLNIVHQLRSGGDPQLRCDLRRGAMDRVRPPTR
jgi:hypothetical protein